MCVSIVCKHCHVNKELHAQQIRLRQHISPLKQRYIIQSWQSVNSHERLLLVSILQEMESDNIKSPIDGEIASRWDAYLLCDICRHFASVMLHFASLITHNLRCIPAFTHQIPTGLFQSSLNDHRDNLYIISYFFVFGVKKGGGGLGGVGENCYICVSHTNTSQT